MVVHKINVGCLAVLETEDNAPVGPRSHRPKAFEVAFQRVQSEGRQPERLKGSRRVQHTQNLPDLPDMIWVYALRVVVLKKLPQPLMSKTFDYRFSVLLPAL